MSIDKGLNAAPSSALASSNQTDFPVIPNARLQATLELFSEVEVQHRPVDAVTSAWFRANRAIADVDRGVVLENLYDLLRHHGRLTWWCARHGRENTSRNQFLVWLALVQEKSSDEIFKLLGGLDDLESGFLAKLVGAKIEHPEMPEGVRLECPDWAMMSLKQRFGARFEAEMIATLTPPPVDLRVNPLKSTVEKVKAELKSIGLEASPMELAENGIRVSTRFSFAKLDALKSGAVEIQDEGSQLVTELVGAKPGDRVVDFCAGAGGKTLAIAAQMNNKGRIIACDVSEGRLKRCSERLRNAGIHNAETRLLTSETDKWIKRHKLGFDRVLIDAPCSGTGTWRRNPDTRWKSHEANGLEDLMALQARILASAARLVKPGGRLVYATCSMLPSENEEQVTRFLSAFPLFKLVPLSDVSPRLARVVKGDYLSLTPAQHGTDGFFAAVIERLPDPVSV